MTGILFDKVSFADDNGYVMEVPYSYWKDGDFYFGYIDEYPQYPTQGETIEDLEAGLKEIYDWVKDGTLKIKEKKGMLKIA
jgi:predicted RNase H-like HicB family nuclease